MYNNRVWVGGEVGSFSFQLRRQARLRREYLYRKSAEDKERSILERKRKLRDAVEGMSCICTSRVNIRYILIHCILYVCKARSVYKPFLYSHSGCQSLLILSEFYMGIVLEGRSGDRLCRGKIIFVRGGGLCDPEVELGILAGGGTLHV